MLLGVQVVQAQLQSVPVYAGQQLHHAHLLNQVTLIPDHQRFGSIIRYPTQKPKAGPDPDPGK